MLHKKKTHKGHKSSTVNYDDSDDNYNDSYGDYNN